MWENIRKRNFNHMITWAELIPFCLWGLWLACIDNQFNDKNEITKATHCYEKAVEYQMLAQHKEKRQAQSNIQVKWTLPNPGYIKLNVDGAVKENPEQGGIGGVFRDHNGQWIGGFSCKIQWTNPLLGELQALHKSLTCASSKNLAPPGSQN